jgi:hypothetical protein
MIPAPEARTSLILTAKSALSTEYQLQRDGAPLTEVRETQGPLSGRFDLEGHTYRVGLAADTSRPWLFGWSVLQAALARGLYALRRDDGIRLASARGQGFRRDGYALVLEDRRFELRWVEARKAYLLEEEGQERGWLMRHPNIRRGVSAELPAELGSPIQVFLTLLALNGWEFVHTGRD